MVGETLWQFTVCVACELFWKGHFLCRRFATVCPFNWQFGYSSTFLAQHGSGEVRLSHYVKFAVQTSSICPKDLVLRVAKSWSWSSAALLHHINVKRIKARGKKDVGIVAIDFIW